jgi:hypothetical protein
LTPVQVFGISSSATAVASLGNHTAVLLADGTVRTFGDNTYGQLGIGAFGGIRQTPVTVLNVTSATAVACGAYHTAILLADGTVRTFGLGLYGQLGNNSKTSRSTIVQVLGISSLATTVACGDEHTIVLLSDGTVKTFGYNDFGQLGVNGTTSRLTPVQVLNILNAGSLASTTFLTSAQTPFTFNGPVFTTNLGLGRVPDISYQLDLSSDGARKLQSSTWTTGSDRRIKSDIQTANLARCAEIVDSLDLKYFEWLAAEHTDKHSLGWIAQDVLTFFPKSVSLTESGTLALDSDQLVKVLWGALKHTLNEHFAPEVPPVSEPVPEATESLSENTTEVPVVAEPVPEVTEPVPEVTEFPPVSESLSVDPVPEASESLSEPVAEPVVEVPEVTEPVAAVTEPVVVTEVTEVTEPVPEVTEVPAVSEPVAVPEVTEPVPEVTEVPVVPEVTEVPAVSEPVAVPEVTEVTEVPVVPEVTEVPAVSEVTEVPAVSEPVVVPEVTEVTEVPVVPEVTEVPATTESLSVDPVPEASENLSENTVEVPAVPEVTEPVPEVTEVTEVPAVSEPVVVPEVTEVPATTESLSELVTEVPVVAEVTEPVAEVTEPVVVPEVTEVPAVTEPVPE